MIRNDTKRRLGLLLSLLLVVTLLLPCMATPVAAVSQAQIDALEAERDELRAQREEMQGDIDALKAEHASVLEQKLALDAQNEVYRQEIELIDEQVALYTRLVDEKAQEVEDARAEEEAQLASYSQHVRAMEENGKYTYLSILFGSRSLSELLTNLDMIGEIMEADKRLYEQYTAAREGTELVMEEYELMLSDLGERQSALEAEKAALELKIEEATQLVIQLEADIDKNQALFEEMLAEEQAREADIQAMIAELERQEAANSIVSTGSYIWPLPGYTPGTRTYGWKMHPIYNEMRFHAGQDIGAPSGTPIIAADSGTVSLASEYGGYGNCVMVNHGGGRVTLYAHMSAFNCSYGQSVAQGDVIGYVGSTGLSTGPHLHFETRVDGVTVDPMQYFSFG